MELSVAFLAQLLRETLTDPKAGARRLIGLDPPMAGRWLGLALIVVLSVIFGQVSLMLATGGATVGGIMGAPLLSGALQGVLLVGMVVAVHQIGRAMGGTGGFPDALLLVTWLQAIMVALQAAQIVLQLVMPALATLVGLAGMVLFLWLLTNFVAVLHGFASLGRVFFAIIGAAFALAFIATLVLSMIGIQPPQMV